MYCQSSGSGSISANHYLYFNINGSDKRNETVKVNVSSPNAYIAIASGTTDAIQHNNDGTKSITFSAQIKASSYGVSASTSGTFTLSTIARASSVSGGSGNIGSTSTISISRASSSFTHTLRYAFGSLSGTIATGVGTSYTWTIPTSFYAQIPSAKSGTGTIYCDTYSGSTLIGTKSVSFTATATESSCRPTVSATIKDTNSTTTALTGNSSKLVKYKSTAQLVITSSVKNSATIKSVTVNGTNVGTSSSITESYSNVSTTSFTIVVTDSRGYTNTSYVVTPSYVNYVPLTVNANFFRPQPTTGEVQLTYSGNYFNGSFGSVSNTLSITWKYKVQGASSWTTGGTITPTLSGNTISSKTISLGTNFNYQTAYDFQLTATDKLTTITRATTVPVGMPVFYWGKDFFNVTKALTINQTYQGGNVPIASTSEEISFDDIGVGKALNKSGLYTIMASNTGWFNLINVRHRNGVSDGVGHGMQIRKNLTSVNSELQIRSHSSGWTAWETLYRAKSLYDNSSGTNGTVTLSETSANFSYLEIFFKNSVSGYESVKVYSPNGKKVTFTSSHHDGAIYLFTKRMTISGTSISNNDYGQSWWSNGGSANIAAENKITIVKVIGYR